MPLFVFVYRFCVVRLARTCRTEDAGTVIAPGAVYRLGARPGGITRGGGAIRAFGVDDLGGYPGLDALPCLVRDLISSFSRGVN